MAAKEPSSGVRPNLVFGLVGAVGTDLRAVSDDINQVMLAFGYDCHEIRLSGLITTTPLSKSKRRGRRTMPEDARISGLMDAGNRIRAAAKDAGAVALLAIQEMYAVKATHVTGEHTRPRCFILNSLKHKDEVDLLRSVYGRSFFCISTQAALKERLDRLTQAIGRGHRRPPKDLVERARYLTERDQNEPDNKYGQNVRDAFCQADVFVRSGAEQHVQLERFVRLLFGDPTITPTFEEHAMFHAKAAGLRSADLSRQVGAAIVSSEGQIVGVGCNEVPKPGGGHFWPFLHDVDQDDRDFRYGQDPNARMIREMLNEVILNLKKKRWFNKRIAARKDTQSLVEDLFTPGEKSGFKELRAGNLIEFGRIVHAEMSAITDAARRGVSVERTYLVCTTFPCHMCARHIISSGISKVWYIEPYPKSLTADLYADAVSIDPAEPESKDGRVVFSSFIGVSPNRFVDLFSYRKGKTSEGYAIDWTPTAEMFPRIYEPELTPAMLEVVALGRLTSLESATANHRHQPTKSTVKRQKSARRPQKNARRSASPSRVQRKGVRRRQ